MDRDKRLRNMGLREGIVGRMLAHSPRGKHVADLFRRQLIANARGRIELTIMVPARVVAQTVLNDPRKALLDPRWRLW